VNLTSPIEGPPLLSILIPTYNRANHLKQLLEELELQLCLSSPGSIEVIVSDNCSVDDTALICKKASESSLYIRCISRRENIGPDENFLSLVNQVKGAYFWMLGDDDLPRRGFLPLLLDLLRSKKPTLLYMDSFWHSRVFPSMLEPIKSLDIRQYNAIDFARTHHIWTTFISSWIVSRHAMTRSGITSDSLALGVGSYFIQLGWIIPLFAIKGAALYSLPQKCILATSSNQRGDHFLGTFCISYPDAVVRLAGEGSPLARSLISPFLVSYLPRLILGVRLSQIGDRVDVLPYLFPAAKRLWSYPAYWAFCLPVLILPLKVIQFLQVLLKRLKGKAKICLKRISN
jgi:abequosyltransferase